MASVTRWRMQNPLGVAFRGKTPLGPHLFRLNPLPVPQDILWLCILCGQAQSAQAHLLAAPSRVVTSSMLG